MHSKGYRFTLGVWGLGVFARPLDVAQPSATIRASPIWPCLCYVLQKVSLLEVAHIALLRFAWQAWHFVTFRLNVSKVVLCGRHNTFLRRFEKMRCQFSWQVQHFGRVHRHFEGQAQHFRRVVLRAFANCIVRFVRAASSGDEVQIPWQAWHFVRSYYNEN